jgi:CspA family cold shock protein
MAAGKVKWFDQKQGFGFVVNETGQDVFVHYSSITGDGFRMLKESQLVEFEQVASEKGLLAKNVRVVVTQ